MKTRKQTDRRYHIRRVKSGAVPVRKHLMHYWAKTNTFRGRFNSAGGKQYVNTFEPRNKKAVLEIQHLVEPSGLKYSAVALRKHDWEQGRWERKEFRSKAEAEAYAKTIMSKDSDGDGVPDIVDCNPHDPTKQDRERYSYDWVGYGLILKDSQTGKNKLIQGEEGSKLHDELEKLWNKKKWAGEVSKEQINDSIISEYFEV